jgi:hypothetical protein
MEDSMMLSTGIYDTSVEPISCLTPLGIVLCFSIFKEGYEDTQYVLLWSAAARLLTCLPQAS